MSKLFDKYTELKRNNSNKYYLFKSGIFYIFIDQDALYMSPILNLKLTHLNEKILKCGFPINNIDKYYSIFKTLQLDIDIVENNNSKNTQSINCNEFIFNIDTKKFLQDISSINPYSLSISEAFQYLEDIQEKANILLKKIKL